MPQTVPASSCAKSLLIALCLLSLTSCAGSGTKRWAERAALCDQPRQTVPDWPAELADFPAYALELLGVIEADRAVTAIERKCRADL